MSNNTLQKDNSKNLVDFSENLISTKFNSLPPEVQAALVEKAAQGKINLGIKATEDAMINANALQNIDNHINTTYRLSRERYSKGADTITSDIETSSGNIRIQSKSGYCYVATATYRNPNHYNVIILRDYRDRYLSRSLLGRCFIVFYYHVGKYLAFFPNQFKSIRLLSQKVIDKIVDCIVEKHYK